MAYTRGRCTNLDYCSIAAARRDVEVRVGDDFVCPECGKPLKAPQVAAGATTNYVLPGIIGVGVLLLIGGGIVVGMRVGGGAPATPPVNTMAPHPSSSAAAAVVAPQAPAENVLARLTSSARLARSMAAPLAAAYLAQIGDTDIKTTAGAAPDQTKVTGTRGDRPESILISDSTTAAGFKALGSHQTDIVLSPRRLLATERDALAPLGDMTSPNAEHLLGLGGLAIVVNAANALPGLRRDQITSIFTGAVRDWSALGGSAGPIDVYGLDGSTELGANFSTLALGGNALAPSAKHLDSAAAVAAAIAADPRGLGFVDLADIGQTRVVPIADTGATPVSPADRMAIAHEDYPFAYRVYLYTAPGAGAGGFAQRFVEYAQSPAGQAVMEQHGLVSQSTKPVAPPPPQTVAGSYKQFVAGAKKIAITYHFEPNSVILDQKSQRDIDRVKNYMLSNHFAPDQLILVGFADNQGDPAANLAVSKKRADAVAALFIADGVKPGKVAGFGAELEVADNATEEGREKNRRVEVYIKQ